MKSKRELCADNSVLRASIITKNKLIDTLAELLETHTDDDECSFDHHGYCQTHFGDNPCRNVLAKHVLDEVKKSRGKT